MTAETLTPPPLTATEAERRLPSLGCIDDREIRAETLRLSQFAPAYFWTRPGSARGYHNSFDHGLWAHTLRLSTILDRLADSWVKQGHISGTDVDAAHAAAILHDQRKEGGRGRADRLGPRYYHGACRSRGVRATGNRRGRHRGAHGRVVRRPPADAGVNRGPRSHRRYARVLFGNLGAGAGAPSA